jgi:hypothetical protein
MISKGIPAMLYKISNYLRILIWDDMSIQNSLLDKFNIIIKIQLWRVNLFYHFFYKYLESLLSNKLQSDDKTDRTIN